MEVKKMEIFTLIICVLIPVLLMAQMSRFARPERDDEVVNWYRLGIDETDNLNINNVLLGYAKDFVTVFNYRLPERHVESNGIGMMVNLVDPIMKGDWEIHSYYLTQRTLIYDIIDILVESKLKFKNADTKTGKGTKGDPEVNHEFETVLTKDGLVITIQHLKGQGNRTKYVATGGQKTL
jgi:hypothetical protein